MNNNVVRNNLPWTKKYIPKTTNEIIAQDLSRVKEFVQKHKSTKKKSLLIHGPSGCGKTASVYAIANELELEVIEINASDFRNKGQIELTVGAAAKQRSLFAKGKIILVDELDGIAGRQDYGGIAALAKLTTESSFPIIMTANNPFDSKFSKIRKKCEMVEFEGLGVSKIHQILKKICEEEKIEYEEESLRSIAIRSAGDARGAITDLQIAANMGKVGPDSVIELSERNKTDSMLNALMKIFKTTDEKIALGAFNNVQENMDQWFLWVDENLPREYKKPKDLALAYDRLSRADVFKGRIMRWMHWRYIVYISDLLTAGIALSKEEKYKGLIQYRPTGRILKLWWAKQKNMKKKAIAAKIAIQTHSSTKEIMKNIEYFKVIYKNDSTMAEMITKELELDADEINYLKK